MWADLSQSRLGFPFNIQFKLLTNCILCNEALISTILSYFILKLYLFYIPFVAVIVENRFDNQYSSVHGQKEFALFVIMKVFLCSCAVSFEPLSVMNSFVEKSSQVSAVTQTIGLNSFIAASYIYKHTLYTLVIGSAACAAAEVVAVKCC